MSNRKLVVSFNVRVGIGNFRAFMKRLWDHLPVIGLWVSSEGEELHFLYEPNQGRNGIDETPPGEGSWGIKSKRNGGSFARINAYEVIPGETRVDFFDGYMPWHWADHTPIGPAFVEFCQWVKEEAKEARLLSEPQSEPTAGGDAPGLVRTANDYTPSGIRISDLSPRDRRVYNLWFGGNHTRQQAASELGIGDSTVGLISKDLGIDWKGRVSKNPRSDS